MIEARHISKSFGSLQVLRQVDLDIPDRQVTTIVGSSGAGKTTLLQILGTLMKPDEGTVMLGGTDISSLSGSSPLSGTARLDSCFSFTICCRNSPRSKMSACRH